MQKEPLSVTHPELCKEWNYEKNGELTPDMVTFGGHDIVWWKGSCGHEWRAMIGNRVNGTGCPYCTSRKLLKGFNDFKTLRPELAAEWSDKNLPLTPDQVGPYSRKKVWWKCKNGHEWIASVHNRSMGNGCAICGNKVILPGFNDLAATHSNIAGEWSEKNLPLTPQQILATSLKEVWWECPDCGQEYLRSPNARTKFERACPYCSGRLLLTGQNDLATTDPEIAAEWDMEKNNGFTPEMVRRRQKHYAWWRCRYGHSYGRKIRERTIEHLGCRTCEAEFKITLPLLLAAFYAKQKGMDVIVGGDFEVFIPNIKVGIDHEGLSEYRRQLQTEKKLQYRKQGIRYVTFPKSKDDITTAEAVRRCFGILADQSMKEDIETLNKEFFAYKESTLETENNMNESEKIQMNEETKLILQLLLAQEEETEAGQRVAKRNKRLAPEPKEGLSVPPPNPAIMQAKLTDKEFRDAYFKNARTDMYPEHENNTTAVKDVPIWEKYALTVSEAAQYFHIGENRLRQLVKKDRYAKYLIWNGGRVFIKRKLFEEYLDGENELL